MPPRVRYRDNLQRLSAWITAVGGDPGAESLEIVAVPYLEGDATHQTVGITPADDVSGVSDFQLKFNSTAPDSWTPERPIRVLGDGNARVSILVNSVVDWRDVLIIGTLHDA